MRTWLMLLALLTAGAANAVSVWKWIDKNGVPHYTDRPVPGAERIELTGVPSVPAVTVPGQAQPTGPASSEAKPAQPYRRFVITAPSQQQTLWNIGGTLNVQVELEPPLQAGQRIDVFLDGQRVNVDATSPEFTVPNVYRGVHTMQAVISNANGDDVMRTLAVTFMVQQTSILNPNNTTPPAVRNRATRP